MMHNVLNNITFSLTRKFLCFQVLATVVEDYSNYYVKLPSATITVEEGEPAPEPEPEAEPEPERYHSKHTNLIKKDYVLLKPF